MRLVEARRARALALVRRYGWNPSSFQILDPGYRYWFTRDALVAYADTGQALVAAGDPICAADRLTEVSQRFVRAAAKRGRRVSFFGVHERFTREVSWPSLHIGELPYWDPMRWPDTVASSARLRKQLRRTRAAGVRVEPASVLSHDLARELLHLRKRWLAGHGMAAMSFLVGPPDLSHVQSDVWLARAGGRLVGFLCTAPIYQRDGMLLGDLVRDPGAPNGTSELLVDGALRAAAAARVRYATLGLAPLAGPLPIWLRIARALGRPLYNFEGLQAFKAKLRPQGTESMRLIAAGGGVELATLDALTAFAGGSLTSFLASTLRKRWFAAA